MVEQRSSSYRRGKRWESEYIFLQGRQYNKIFASESGLANLLAWGRSNIELVNTGAFDASSRVLVPIGARLARFDT